MCNGHCGKKAKTIIIHINGNLADLEGTAPTKPGLNQSRVIFGVEVRITSSESCDLCGEARDCSQKEIEGKEYDICAECWKPLEQKLRGKGRVKKELVFLPPPAEIEREREKPGPGEPPKIWGEIQPN